MSPEVSYPIPYDDIHVLTVSLGNQATCSHQACL
jgi:hypothetical protein